MTVANLGYKPRPARVWAGSCRPVVETVRMPSQFQPPVVMSAALTLTAFSLSYASGAVTAIQWPSRTR